jgi:hypothetical protein
MKYTLLDLTQSVLSSMDSDEINSITDTVESLQVVEVIKTVYDDIVSRTDLNVNKTLFNLTASTDNTKPTLMTKPDGIDTISWIKYDGRKDTDTTPAWNTLSYMPMDAFIDYMHAYNPNETNVVSYNHVTNGYTITFTFRNDTAPQYYTSFNDNEIFFDSYDASVDTTLQSIKTLCYGSKISDFQKVDGYIPNLQPQQFALLLNEAKSLAWAELKQTTHAKAEATARRNWRHLSKTRQQVPDGQELNSNASSFNRLPNLARKV